MQVENLRVAASELHITIYEKRPGFTILQLYSAKPLRVLQMHIVHVLQGFLDTATMQQQLCTA